MAQQINGGITRLYSAPELLSSYFDKTTRDKRGLEKEATIVKRKYLGRTLKISE